MSTRRDRAARAIAEGMAAELALGFTADEMPAVYRIADAVLAEVDRVPDISELIEASSLGTPGAKALRASVSDEQAQRAIDVANRIRSSKTDDGAVRSPATPGAVTNPAAQAEGTGWRPAPSSPLPRPFLLFRIRDVSGTSGTGVVAWGCEFPDGAAALRWNGPHPSTAAWPSVEDIVAVHGHQGATVIRWLNTTLSEEDPTCPT